MTPPAAAVALEPTLAEVAAAHHLLNGYTDHKRGYSGYTCLCGDVVVQRQWPGDYIDMHAAHLAAVLAPVVAAAVERAVEEAFEAAANDLEWVRPEVCPCVHPEACCGSEESCDAMQPSMKVVGADWLRSRGRIVREGGQPS